MANQTFLEKLSVQLVQDYSNKLHAVTIILPNRRARIFLLEALKKQISGVIFAPVIISIEDFIQDVAGIRPIDTIELLFEFYNVYLGLTPKDKQQPFENFANWAKTLLQDFNEIDRYLLNADYVLKYLENIEEIEHWAVDADNRTPMIDNYLEFHRQFPVYYHTLYKHLQDKGIGYQGLIYREAVDNIEHYSASLQQRQLVFAGFNALNAAEEKIIQHLMMTGQAKIYWDIDYVFLQDPYHDAGLFVRKFKKEWRHYAQQPFEWITNDYSEPKNINIIGTPKTVGQAKIAGQITEKLIGEGYSLDKTAIVLAEENLLVPLLYSLPSGVGSLNITMGYSSRNNPAQILLQKLFKLHTNALNRESGYTFYYREVLDILTHPLVEPYAGAKKALDVIKSNNFTFFSDKKLFEIQETATPFFNLLFERWQADGAGVAERLQKILLEIKEFLGDDNEQDKISKAFLYSVFKVINKIISYSRQHPHINSLGVLHSVYKEAAELAEVSFEGEPLSGLQIMGVLESRVLDFENVIITSVNEGKFPAGKTQNSFIPYDVKLELGLPTYKEKDAIYSYHFYHLLLRAKNVYLLYNTESEGLDAGEPSRFITQLEIETQPKHNLQKVIYNAYLPDKAYEAMTIPKTESVQERLREIATVSGFSPSALTGYIRNPIQFYYQKVLRIREMDEVEESIALNTLGTIIHGALEELYKPYIGKYLALHDIENMNVLADDEVMRQFKLVYKEGEIKKGRNLLAFEVAKRNVHNLLKQEQKLIEEGDAVKLLSLETKYSRWLKDERLPYPVLISGNIDRIEERNGRIRIVDYKTGKVDKFNVTLKQWEGLTADIKFDKIIQLLTYVFMYEPEANGKEIEAGIISFKNMKSGFMGFTFKDMIDKSVPITEVISADVMQEYLSQLVQLINEILNPEQDFTEKLD
ncbi:PD-(D/E)XK nuclease family protein [Flavobacterium rhizosphaerae]|uniref:PD-(D/E)XK nuclease family protein n=1 Tax=Flavobacterium rhizosphaerae TaxID=3163298 RepID=A0ABW8YYL0_9FLAO